MNWHTRQLGQPEKKLATLQPQARMLAIWLRLSFPDRLIGALIADFAGLTGIEAMSVEAGGASGGAALRAGAMAVASGLIDVALVVGVEKVSDQIGGAVDETMGTSEDSDYESVHGLTPTSQAAMLMQRYLFETNAPREAFGAFPLIAHANGVGNPHAMFRKAITTEAYQKAGLVCPPLNMYDIAPLADGAAAVVLTRPQLLPSGFPHPLVRIAGSSLSTDTLALHDRPDPLHFRAVDASVQKACQKARLSPLQMDFFELYDAYSIFTVLSLEAAGFARRGEGWKLAQTENGSGPLNLQGSFPISTMGGLKARGNPGGATGVFQIVEAVQQLRGQAGANQIPHAKRALVQSLGGPASTAVTHVLEALD